MARIRAQRPFWTANTKALVFGYCPYLALWTAFVTWGMVSTYRADFEGIKRYSNTAVTVGLILQYILLFVVVRDWIGVIEAFRTNFPSPFIALAHKLKWCLCD